jgi:hypothetical protein
VHQVRAPAPTQMPLVMSKIFYAFSSLFHAFEIKPDRVTMATGTCDHTNADMPKGLAQTCVERCIAADVSHQADGCEDEDRETCNTAFMMVKNGLSGAKLHEISGKGRNSNLSLLALSLSEEKEQPCIHSCIAGHIYACACAYVCMRACARVLTCTRAKQATSGWRTYRPKKAWVES